MKILKYILIAVVLLGSEQIASSQYYLKVKSDSISLESDSALIFVSGYRGTINWQASSDLKNWISLNKHNDTLGVRIDSSAYYRATVVEENCNPVMSDTAFLIEKLTITGSNQFTVDSLGGVFLLPSGVKVKIPKGAVIEPKVVKLDTISSDSVNVLAGINIASNNSFLSGISLATDTFNFRKPIKIKIPVQNIADTSLPALYEFKNENNAWLFSDEAMIVSSEGKFIEIILKGSDQKGDFNNGGSKFSLNDIRSFFLELWGDIFWSGDGCREAGGFWVETRAIDYATGEGCTGVQVQEDIKFYGCDPTQSDAYVARVLSPECEPELKYPPGGKIKKGESVNITLKTEIGSFPLSHQEIHLSTTGNLLTTKPIIFTDDIGNVSFDVKGTEVGYGTVFVSVLFDYYLTTSFVEHNGTTEYYEPEEDYIKIKQDYGINVTVYYYPEVITTSVTDIKCTSATVSGNVIDENYDPVTERGVIVDGIPHPAGSGPGPFSVNLSGLECNTAHSVKAYATNLAGKSYGNEVSFTTLRLDECIILSTVIKEETYSCTSVKIDGHVIDVVSDGSLTVTERGFNARQSANAPWGKYPRGNGTGTFGIMYIRLNPDLIYYVRTYATTECGTVYGNEVIINTSKVLSTVADIDGNVYQTVKIGNQVWMAENLKTTRLNNGEAIPYIEYDFDWIGLEYNCAQPQLGQPGRCYYDNNSVNNNIYGSLYNGFAVTTGNLCPVGWHVPSETDWEALVGVVGPWFYPAQNFCGTLKETGTLQDSTGHWCTPNEGATDEFCFTALPGGSRFTYLFEHPCLWADYPRFLDINDFGIWWTSTSSIYEGIPSLKCRILFSSSTGIGQREPSDYRAGNSVRCMKDSDGTKAQSIETSSPSEVDNVAIIPVNDK